MNLANKLTVSRLFLAAVFLRLLYAELPGSKAAALVIFLLASLTDYWDGEIARRRNQITLFGKLMDPIADKVLTLSAFLGFVELGLIPAWMAVVIIARDLLITGVRLMAPRQSQFVAARRSGKHKTAVQFAAIILILLFLAARSLPGWDLSWTPAAYRSIYWGMFFVVAVTLVSGVRYLVVNREWLTGHHGDDPQK